MVPVDNCVAGLTADSDDAMKPTDECVDGEIARETVGKNAIYDLIITGKKEKINLNMNTKKRIPCPTKELKTENGRKSSRGNGDKEEELTAYVIMQ